MGVEVISGRSLIAGHVPDSLEGIILNETAINILGWTPEDAIGKEASVGDLIDGRIIGVVRDFHFNTLHTEMGPLAMFVPRSFVENVFVKYTVNEDNPSEFLANMSNKWEEIDPEQPLSYTYLENNIAQLYAKDKQFGNLIYLFSIISIVISCIGLYGIVEFHVRRKLKEVGIRKVMGASSPSIFSKLSKGFVILVLVSSSLGLIGSLFVMETWLSNFAYRIDISAEYLIIAILTVLFIAFATITFQVAKISRLNPLQVIREE